MVLSLAAKSNICCSALGIIPLFLSSLYSPRIVYVLPVPVYKYVYDFSLVQCKSKPVHKQKWFHCSHLKRSNTKFK